jgi:hypothetical protein
MLTTEQATTLAAHIRANTDQAVIDALEIRNDVLLAELYNATTSADAWISSMASADLFDAMDVTKFDALTAGKRDAWRLMLDFAPIDMTKVKTRKGVQDVWGDTNSVAVLEACRRKATVAEVALGGETKTTNTVSALKLDWEGTLTYTDVGIALNNNPA